MNTNGIHDVEVTTPLHHREGQGGESVFRKLKITEMNRISVEEFHSSEKMPLVVVLDSVRSLYNVGSVFRTCDAFRVAEVILCGITATPPHTEIHKTALGAEDSVDWRYFKDTMDAVKALKSEGYTLLAVEQCEGSTMLNDFNPKLKVENSKFFAEGSVANAERNVQPKYAVILGNEVKGVQQCIVDACEGCLEIPQFGTKHSLNVSVTAGIIIWHFAQYLLK